MNINNAKGAHYVKSAYRQKVKDIKENMHKDPIWTIKVLFKQKLWKMQKKIIRSVWANKHTTVKSCHAIGKTMISANVMTSFLYTFHNSIVLNTAPTWRQVEKLIWKEIRMTIDKAIIPLGGELAPKAPDLQIIQDVWYMSGLSTNEPDKFQGYHAPYLLLVIDEAAGVKSEIFEAAEGILTSENNKILLLGNPTSIDGEFYTSFKTEGYQKFSISAFDTPNFTALDITRKDIRNGDWKQKVEDYGVLPTPFLITPEWVADKYKRWGENSIAYQARVEAQFPENASDTIIPLAWIEAACERYSQYVESDLFMVQNKRKSKILIVDIARFGSDDTVITLAQGPLRMVIDAINGNDTMSITGKIIAAYKKHRADYIFVDTIGVGAGVFDRLKEQEYPVIEVNVSESAKGINKKEEEEMKNDFLNLRAQLWWMLRDALNPNNKNLLGIKYCDGMFSDASLKYNYTSNGKIQMESKKDFKKRTGHSTDVGDTLAMSMFNLEWIIKQKRRIIAPQLIEKGCKWNNGSRK